MTVPASRTVDNSLDTSRKYPTTTLAERVLTAAEGVVLQRLPGAGIGATVALAQPITPNTPVYVLAFVTIGGAPAAKTLLDLATDYTVTVANANGVGELTMVTDQSLNTLLIAYSPDQPEAPRGGQSLVG